jgi:hypothetical protein
VIRDAAFGWEIRISVQAGLTRSITIILATLRAPAAQPTSGRGMLRAYGPTSLDEVLEDTSTMFRTPPLVR